MWIDSHCHLDAEEFDADRDDVVERARAAGVRMMLVPAVEVGTFQRARDIAHRYGFGYALGIHPLYVSRAQDADLERLSEAVQSAQVDPNFAGIGGIGPRAGDRRAGHRPAMDASGIGASAQRTRAAAAHRGGDRAASRDLAGAAGRHYPAQRARRDSQAGLGRNPPVLVTLLNRPPGFR